MTRDPTDLLLDDEVLEAPRHLTVDEVFSEGGPGWRRLDPQGPDREDDR